MKKQQNNKGLNLLIGIIFIISPIIGIILGVIAIVEFENYFSPYLFAATCGGFGLVTGYLISKKIKPFVTKLNKRIKDYSQLSVYLISGFIGLFLLIGVKMNFNFSRLEYSDTTIVINKTYKKGKFRQAGYNKLFFKLNGELIDVRCHKKYWNSVNIGQKIKIEVYKSRLGFDYILLPNEKKASL